jgi:hypothetical protein
LFQNLLGVHVGQFAISIIQNSLILFRLSKLWNLISRFSKVAQNRCCWWHLPDSVYVIWEPWNLNVLLWTFQVSYYIYWGKLKSQNIVYEESNEFKIPAFFLWWFCIEINSSISYPKKTLITLIIDIIFVARFLLEKCWTCVWKFCPRIKLFFSFQNDRNRKINRLNTWEAAEKCKNHAMSGFLIHQLSSFAKGQYWLKIIFWKFVQYLWKQFQSFRIHWYRSGCQNYEILSIYFKSLTELKYYWYYGIFSKFWIFIKIWNFVNIVNYYIH